jgi:hypothetical protein
MNATEKRNAREARRIWERDVNEASRIWNVTDKWGRVDTERMSWIVTLRSGKQITIACPLGAAVELETEMGYEGRIEAGVLPV